MTWQQNNNDRGKITMIATPTKEIWLQNNNNSNKNNDNMAMK